MAVIKYKDKNGNWKVLTENFNIKAETDSGIHIGDEEPIDPAIRVWYDTSYLPTPLAKCKLDSGEWVTIAGGGGGNGSSTNNAEFTVTNETGWLTKTIAYGAKCSILISWSSIEDGISTGNGTAKISVGGVLKSSFEIQQGKIPIEIDKYLVNGINDISITISDIYGNTRILKFTVTTVSVSISSYFDSTTTYTGDINFGYTPVGAVEKTVYFIVDGGKPYTQTVTASNREQSFTIPSQSHGSHTFEVYFECNIDGQNVESNHLFYDIICCEEGNITPIIACAFNTNSVKQYATLPIEWIVYTPQLLTTDVTITDNFGYSKSLINVDRTVQTLSYKAENIGVTNITFTTGEINKVISFETVENQIDVEAETENLELYLTAKNRSNNEDKDGRSLWQYGSTVAQMNNFNFTSDGWQLDNNGDTVLRVSGNARVYIPFNIFGTDFKTSGKTIEFEFATRDVLNYDTVILSCMSAGRGVEITAQKALLSFEGGEISTQYKEDEHIRIAFTIDKQKENRLVKIYINGIMSGVLQYADNTDFSQAFPVGISIGSSDCTTDIYCIRVYSNNLSQYQILDNWIADTQNIEDLIARYNRNNIFDDYDYVSIEQLPKTLPYMVLEAENYKYLPQYKGDKERPVSGRYVDPLYPQRSFTFYDAQIDVQGTSSQYYARKNYKIKFKNGFTIDGKPSETYQLRETSVPTNVFTFKADVASSEGVNNVELCKLYDDACPVNTPPQDKDSRVRQGIEGYPCLMFYYDGETYHLLGKYNFNNDKGTPEVFGLDDNDESWEILLNNTKMAKWKDTDFSSTYIDEEDGEEKLLWQKTFEARHPEDNTVITNLKALAEWLKSTDTTAVNTEEEKVERLAKFANELSDWFNVDMLIFNYIFTELFLLVDNRAKNAFPTRYNEDGKWVILPYDYDTAIGTNNEGKLQFGYQFEDTDFVRGKELITAEQAENEGIDVETDDTVDYTYNGQDSVLYVNLRKCFAKEIKAMYQRLRSEGVLSYEEVERRFSEHQNVWGEAIFNEDARFKYIDPLIEEGNSTYLPMLQGSKAEQRKWWLYNRFRYLDSKYNTGDASKDYINLKAFALSDITLVPYADIYATASFDGIIKQTRAFRSNACTIENPADLAQGQVVAIYSAPQIAQIGDLSGFDLGLADLSKATRLSGTLKIGDENRINAKLTELTIGNLTLLSTINAMNCTALTQTVDVSGCTNIEHLYLDGSNITGVILPNGGILKTLHLPSTITNLTIKNQSLLSEVVIPSYVNISTLCLEGVNYNLFDIISILNQITTKSRVRLLGLEMILNTAEEIFALYDKFDTFRGIDEQDATLDTAVVGGTIHCGTITSNDYAEMMRRYPNIKIDYEHITSTVDFYVEGELVHSVLVYDEGDCYNPITEGIITTPTKEESDTSKFIYNSWDTLLTNITENKIINAVFDEYKKHIVKFIDDKGNIVQVDGNDTKTYYYRVSENIITIPTLEDYIYTDDKGVTYNMYFKGWKNINTQVEGVVNINNNEYEEITYEAVFTSSRVYVVKFIDPYNEALSTNNYVWSTLRLEKGESITIPDNPTMWESENGQYYHNFKGWSTISENLNEENIVDVAEIMGTEDLTYYAVYDSVIRSYLITFYGIYGGTDHRKEKLLYQNTLDWGTPIPVPTDLAVVGYTFKNWDKKVDTTVLGERTYTADYEINTYTIKFLNGNNVVSEQEVNYDVLPEDPSKTTIPTKNADAQYTYTFVGWSPSITKATTDVIYTADYSTITNKYTITFLDDNGCVLSTQTVEYGETPKAPTSTREHYAIESWSPEITVVTSDATYTAQYIPIVYTVTKKPAYYVNDAMGILTDITKSYDNDVNSYAYIVTDSGGKSATFKYSTFNLPAGAVVHSLITYAKMSSQTDAGYGAFQFCAYTSDSNYVNIGDRVSVFRNSTISPQYFSFECDLEEYQKKLNEYKAGASIVDSLNEDKGLWNDFTCGSTGSIFGKKDAEVRIYDVYTTVTYTVP